MSISAIKSFIFLLLTCFSCLLAQTIISSDYSALIAFKSHLILDKDNLLLSNWTSKTHFCNWYGVSCINSRVAALQLQGLALQGIVSSDVANLTQLVYLDLSSNDLGGSLPSELGFLQHLRLFNITKNSIQGDIPSNISRCHNLEELYMSNNYITGSIPQELGDLSNLRALRLNDNNLTGKIPASLGNLSKLEFIYLFFTENDLNGPIPSEFGKLKNMQWFEFEYNQISGNIPAGIFNSSSLQYLKTRHNYLSGAVPSDLGQWLPNLQEIFLSHNLFSGEIPSTICNATKLVSLEVSNNSFSGPVPPMLGNLVDLQHLNLQNNLLVNAPHKIYLDFLDSLVNCKKLEYLILQSNPLNGIIPESVGNLSVTLKVITATFCMISGTIPEGIGNLSSLSYLGLTGNNLQGNIPLSFARLQNVERIYLTGNMLSGIVPDYLSSLKNLGILHLGENKFTGKLPFFIGNLTNLVELSLAANGFRSEVPQSFWGLMKLQGLNLSMNQLQGILAPEVGNLKAITIMDISSNNFSGEIPNSIGNLQNLISLYLSNNSFEGHIPSIFSKLIVLEYLDLSLNSLSGEIPASLELLKDLRNLNISYNKLQGPLPNKGVFANLTYQSVIGNNELCGSPSLNLLPCNVRKTHKSRRSNILKITLPLSFAIVSLILTVLTWLIIRRKKQASGNVAANDSLRKGHQIVTYYELVRATEHFSDLNLIGRGNSGMVYKGTLSDGTIVAIKVFNMLREETMKTFDAECDVFSKVRHRNLVKIISTCSNMDFKAMVLQFMPNGSLDEWLHSPIKYLNFQERVNILIDTAQAVEYLHHDYVTTIVHCDLKPSNVLLDADMTAHVADFGIAKIFAQDQQVAQTRTLGTIGYIAPEYGIDGKISTKNDVYSFGILLLETFTRKRPTDSFFAEDLNLQNWVTRSFPEAVMDVLDTELRNEVYRIKEANINSNNQIKTQVDKLLVSIINVGLMCLKESPEERSTMREVVVQLKKIRKETRTIAAFCSLAERD